MPLNDNIRKECIIRGVSYEILSNESTSSILSEIDSASSNMDAVILEKAPKIAVYSPSSKQPWDDAVTLVLTYAEIPYDIIYDREVLNDALVIYDWLHLHHEDLLVNMVNFDIFKSAAWYIEAKQAAEILANELGYKKSFPESKRDVALKIKDYVTGGGFMFAMCSATDSFDIALAAQHIDICEAMFDGDPSTPSYQNKLDFSEAFAFKNFILERNPNVYEFSSIDMTSRELFQNSQIILRSLIFLLNGIQFQVC